MKTSFKINHFLLIAIAICISVSISCSKDRIEEENEEEEEEVQEYVSMNDYYETKKQDEQEFVIDTAGSGPIIGNQGTKVYPDHTNLMFQNGDSVNWPYTVKLVELYTAKDMIYYQMPSVASGELLSCDGEIRVRAFKNGEELVLRPSKTWMVEMPNSSPQNNMSIFYGHENGSYTDWVDTPAGSFTTTSYGYLGNIAQLGWASCSKNATNISSITNYSFTSTTDNLQNVSIFAYFPNLKSLSQVYNQTSGDFPNGENMKVIIMGTDSNNQLFHYYTETTVGSNSQIDVTMSQISDTDLTAILDGL